MRIFNKFVESKKAPQNYQDIWFDGSVVRLYKQGSWEEVSLPIEDLKMLQSFVSTAEVFQIVTELPEEGLADYIYVLLNVTDQNPSIKLYTYVDSTWEEIGGMASSSLLKLSDCLIPFIPKKQSIITTEDFKEIVEKYDLINKKGTSLACLYKTNNKNYSFGILTFSENNEYQRVDILSNHSFNDFKTDEKLYNPFNSYENTAWLYNTQYNILTPLGTYTSPEYSPIKDESVTKAKLSKEVQEMLENPTDGPSGEYITPDWNALEGEPGYIENKPNLDVPFEKGESENSAVFKGGNNQVISEGGVALGKNNFVGLKGWYYKAIQFDKTNNVTFLYLSKTQQVPVIVEQASEVEQEKNIDFTLIENDVVSVVNDSKYDNKYKISTDEIATYGRIGIKSVDSNIPFPFNKVNTDEELNNGIFDQEDYSIYCLLKPDVGIADVGQDSFVSGYNNKATNGKATAFGFNNHAYGKFSFVEGKGNEAGYAAHAEGRDCAAKGEMSHAGGLTTHANGKASFSHGQDTRANGYSSFAMGYAAKANGVQSISLGYNTSAEGAQSVALGNNTQAIGNVSHAENAYTVAEGRASHAEGFKSKVRLSEGSLTDNYERSVGYAAHAEGHTTQSIGCGAHSEGGFTTALGNFTHAEGYRTHAKGSLSHSEGKYTKTTNEAEHASGKYNVSTPKTADNTTADATQFSIGIGTSETTRKNAFEVKQNGDVYITGVEGRIQDKLNVSTSVTPDWLAETNEIGYIKNKPFGINNKIGVLTNSNPYIETSTYYDVIFVNNGDIITHVNSDYTGEVTLLFGPPISCKIEVITEKGRTYKKLTLIDNYNYFNDANLLYVYANIKQLDEKYIPDTIARNTQLEQLQEILKYSSLTIDVQNLYTFYDSLNNKSIEEANNYPLFVTYGDETEDTINWYDYVDIIHRFKNVRIRYDDAGRNIGYLTMVTSFKTYNGCTQSFGINDSISESQPLLKIDIRDDQIIITLVEI